MMEEKQKVEIQPQQPTVEKSDDYNICCDGFSIQGKTRCIVWRLNRTIDKIILPNNVKIKTLYIYTKLSSEYSLKDKSDKNHQYDIVAVPR